MNSARRVLITRVFIIPTAWMNQFSTSDRIVLPISVWEMDKCLEFSSVLPLPFVSLSTTLEALA